MSKTGDKDQAYDFLVKNQANSDNEATPTGLRAIRRKVDWNIVPIMFACYTLQFLDKVLLNYGAVMGLSKDLRLVGNDFSNASTFFFIAYLIAEIPNGLILNKVPAGKWLGM